MRIAINSIWLRILMLLVLAGFASVVQPAGAQRSAGSSLLPYAVGTRMLKGVPVAETTVRAAEQVPEAFDNNLRTEHRFIEQPLQKGNGPKPNQVDVTPTPDPDLELGFPVYTFGETGGTYHGGPAIHTLVGNIDADPTLEIVVSSLASGPLYGWNSDGSLQPGWPVSDNDGVGYPAMGNLSTSLPGFEVFSGHWGGRLFAFSGAGTLLPGWPRDSANFVRVPPALGDVDGDGLDEIFIEEEDGRIHGYRADGSVLAGWPVTGAGGQQERNTPALADIDGDGDLEVIFASGPTQVGIYLSAYHANGAPITGFPIQFPNTQMLDMFPVVGDVDGDGALEIVVFTYEQGQYQSTPLIKVISGNGIIERSIVVPTDPVQHQYTLVTTLALADLDGDTYPEIVLQGENFVVVMKGDGSVFPGWPQSWSNAWSNNSAPVVGDVDSDGQPDVVVLSSRRYIDTIGYVRVYDRYGNSHPRFPKEIPIGRGAVPAIADIDLDGRNEIIVRGTAWDGGWTNFPAVWAYDLRGPGPYGPVEWGQLGGGPQHQGLYRSPRLPTPTPVASRTSTSTTTRTPTPTRTPTSSTPAPTMSTATVTPVGCNVQFDDVSPVSPFYEYVRCLSCRGIITGYADGTFRPGNNITRGQAAKIIANSANYQDPIPPNRQTFNDVAPGSTFWLYIERVALHGVISGYGCGGQGEPCPGTYFRPANNLTRGQLAKIDAEAIGYSDPIPPDRQTFNDVAPGSTFWLYVERLALHNVINGYGCGGEGEPCPGVYYRPGNDVTRGQASKMVANTFFPDCQTPARR